jgi:hypothetical protein
VCFSCPCSVMSLETYAVVCGAPDVHAARPRGVELAVDHNMHQLALIL